MKKSLILLLPILLLILSGCADKREPQGFPEEPIPKPISKPQDDNISKDLVAQKQQPAVDVIKDDNFDKKAKCTSLGEQYYANYLKDQEKNEMFSFEVYDISREISYSTNLDTCLIYIMIKYKDIGSKIGGVRNEIIRDLLNNKVVYSMAYSGSSNDNKVLSASDFKTREEFANKKIELFK